MAQGRKNIWTPEEDERLRKLCESLITTARNGLPGIRKESWAIVGAAFPTRGIRACMHRWWDLRGAAGLKRRYRARPVTPKPKDAILTRQDPRALPIPLTITAFVLGDPLPGRSALDRKLAAAQP